MPPENQDTESEPKTFAEALGLRSINAMFGDLNESQTYDSNDEESTNETDPDQEVDESEENHTEDDAVGEDASQNSPAQVTFEDEESDTEKRIKELERKLEANKQKQDEPPKEDPQEPEIDISGLQEDEVDEFEIYQLAASKNPEHAGKPEALAQWYKKVRDLEDKHGDDYDFDEKLEDLKKEKPTIPRREFMKRQTEFYSQEAISESTKDLRDENQKLRDELAKLKSAPEQKAGVETFTSELTKLRGEDLNEIEKEAYSAMEADGKAYVQKYLDLAYGTERYDPQDKTHSAINQFVLTQAQLFQSNGGDKRVKDGKQFALPSEQQKLSQPDKYWTWEPKDIVRIISRQVHQAAQQNVEKEYARLEKLGIDISPLKAKKKSSTQKTQNQTSQASPKSKATPSPGAGKSTEQKGLTMASQIPNIFKTYKETKNPSV